MSHVSTRTTDVALPLSSLPAREIDGQQPAPHATTSTPAPHGALAMELLESPAEHKTR